MSEMVEGRRLSLLVLTEGNLESSANSNLSVHSHLLLSQCVKTYVSSLGAGSLFRNYCAVVASNLVKNYLSEKSRKNLGKWHPIPRESPMTESPLEGSLSWLEGLVSDFSAGMRVSAEEGGASDLAVDMHRLFKEVPATENYGHTLFNVHYIVSSSTPVTPSSVVFLAGAMTRVYLDHEAHLELVLPDSAPWDEAWSEALDSWTRVVGVSRVCPASQWRPRWDVVWRGCVTLPPLEHESAPGENGSTCDQPCDRLCRPVYPGFNLSLQTDNSSSSILEDIGLGPFGKEEEGGCGHLIPSHIELVRSVAGDSIPLETVSPVRGKLSLANAAPEPSKKIFQWLLSSGSQIVALFSNELEEKILGDTSFEMHLMMRCPGEAVNGGSTDKDKGCASFMREAQNGIINPPGCQDSLSPQQERGDCDEADMGLSCGVRFLWRHQSMANTSPQSGTATSEASRTDVAAAEMPLLMDETSQFSLVSWRSGNEGSNTPPDDPTGLSEEPIGPSDAGSSPKKKKKKKTRLKDLLGLAVVAALKKNGLSRSMPSFKPCYVKLFHLTKLFMKDSQLPSSRSSLETEIQRVVRLNVKNVITYHLEQSGSSHKRKTAKV